MPRRISRNATQASAGTQSGKMKSDFPRARLEEALASDRFIDGSMVVWAQNLRGWGADFAGVGRRFCGVRDLRGADFAGRNSCGGGAQILHGSR